MDITEYVSRSEDHEYSDPDWGTVEWINRSSLTDQSALTFGKITMEPGKSHPEHYHPNCAEDLYVLEGTFEHTLEDESTILEAGDLIHLPKGVRHQSTNVGEADAVAIITYDTGDSESIHTADE